MPIPEVGDSGYLPAGDWEATWDEIVERFGTGPRRREILNGLQQVVSELRNAGVTTIWFDGSFVSAKHRPSDVDVVFKPPTDRVLRLPTVMTAPYRDELKRQARVDLWQYPSFGRHGGGPLQNIKTFFETDDDDVPKGHIALIEG